MITSFESPLNSEADAIAGVGGMKAIDKTMGKYLQELYAAKK
ncbi:MULTISPECIES: hypothetical protein [unclassified Paenibacillus]|nr:MULTISPECIES: hypothetical protein [unclassified Paenibacillus]